MTYQFKKEKDGEHIYQDQLYKGTIHYRIIGQILNVQDFSFACKEERQILMAWLQNQKKKSICKVRMRCWCYELEKIELYESCFMQLICEMCEEEACEYTYEFRW